MAWVRGVQVIVIVAVFALFLTQIILPLWRGRPLFPWVRTRERKLYRQRAEVLQDLAEKEMEREIEMLRKKEEGDGTNDEFRVRAGEDRSPGHASGDGGRADVLDRVPDRD